MPLTRLGHVNIRTSRFTETIAFYEALGLVRSPAETMDDQTANAWMKTADGAPCVHVNSAAEPVATPAGPLDHVAFDADDRQVIEVLLERAGIAFERRSHPRVGIVQRNLLDPNGVKVELTFRRSDPR